MLCVWLPDFVAQLLELSTLVIFEEQMSDKSTTVLLFWALGHFPLSCDTNSDRSLGVPRRSLSVAAVGAGSLLRSSECHAPRKAEAALLAGSGRGRATVCLSAELCLPFPLCSLSQPGEGRWVEILPLPFG